MWAVLMLPHPHPYMRAILVDADELRGCLQGNGDHDGFIALTASNTNCCGVQALYPRDRSFVHLLPLLDRLIVPATLVMKHKTDCFGVVDSKNRPLIFQGGELVFKRTNPDQFIFAVTFGIIAIELAPSNEIGDTADLHDVDDAAIVAWLASFLAIELGRRSEKCAATWQDNDVGLVDVSGELKVVAHQVIGHFLSSELSVADLETELIDHGPAVGGVEENLLWLYHFVDRIRRKIGFGEQGLLLWSARVSDATDEQQNQCDVPGHATCSFPQGDGCGVKRAITS